jgi:hypothetical protein
MPYVDDASKRRVEVGSGSLTVGELTYGLQQVVQDFLLDRVRCEGTLRYEHCAQVLGALEGCKADFVDRVLLPYEATKAAQNGDVWDVRLIATNR